MAQKTWQKIPDKKPRFLVPFLSKLLTRIMALNTRRHILSNENSVSENLPLFYFCTKITARGRRKIQTLSRTEKLSSERRARKKVFHGRLARREEKFRITWRRKIAVKKREKTLFSADVEEFRAQESISLIVKPQGKGEEDWPYRGLTLKVHFLFLS